MKNVFGIFIIALGICLLGDIFSNVKWNAQPVTQPVATRKPVTPIRVIVYQDVSGSIKKNGVELISSQTFAPYFSEVTRATELFFGIISGHSAQKLVTVHLPPATFQRPVTPDGNTIEITIKRHAKEQYLNDYKRYEADSIAYFSDRNLRITRFSKQVDSLLFAYHKKLSSSTDLITAIDIADKVFNNTDTARKDFLILNSDGINTDRRTITKIANPVEVILTNAGANRRTSIDAIITKRFESVEEAIALSLKK